MFKRALTPLILCFTALIIHYTSPYSVTRIRRASILVVLM